jgi:glycosyltransferase involved in cell wall biosynthesis
MTSVSILTITQHKRFNCLKNLYDIIQAQTYLEIKEWVVVEGSQNKNLKNNNIENIEDFINKKQDLTDIKMRLIKPDDILALSDLRNLGNDNCLSDIIICMDDDDYYPPTSVKHTVEKLNKYNRLIAGCSGIYFYDFKQNKLYKCSGYHNNHSTNNCMAYKREYLKNHRYKDGLHIAEEYSFTNGFTEPMIQLNPEKCIIVSIHEYNTVDKQEWITDNEHIFEVKDKNILDIIPHKIFKNMKDAFLSSTLYNPLEIM